MPAKSHGKKHYIQKKQPPKAAPVGIGAAAPKDSRMAVVTATPPLVNPAPVPATQPAPRRSYVGKELLRVLVVSAIVLAILVVLVLVLR